MSTKKYTAKSHVSVSVVMGNNTSAHISFTPITGGGSVLYVSDERLQKALEQHPKFNKLFKVDALYKEKTTEPVQRLSITRKDAKEVHVSCLDDAKDYLCDKLGISRTKLRSEESIKKAAAANNIKFIGLE